MNFPMYNPYQFYNPQMQQQNKQDGNTLVPIHSEQEVFNYPVAPGHSVSFKHENEPFIYIKTTGLSQFDQPIVTKYRLIKEDVGDSKPEPNNSTPSDIKSLNEDDLKPIIDEIEKVKAEIEIIKKQIEEINSTSIVPQLPMKESK